MRLRRTAFLDILILIGLCLAFSTAAGCCGARVETVYPLARDGRTPDAQASAAAAIQSVCVEADGRVSIGFGSGVLIGPRALMTASHVVDCKGSADYNVEFRDGVAHKGELTIVDLKADIAILHLDADIPFPPLAYGPRPQEEERVCIASAIPSRSRRCGEVTGFDDLPGDVRHEALTEPGNSGSGVYDSRGRLVGIVTHFIKCSNGQLCGGSFSTVRGSRQNAVVRLEFRP